MKLNLDNKYHCQLPRAGRDQEAADAHTPQGPQPGPPRDRGLHHLRDPAPTIGVFPTGVEPATQTGRFTTSPGGGGSTQHSPGTKDVSPGCPRAGLLRTTAVRHGVGATSEPALGVVPGPDQAIQPPHTGPGCTPPSPASPGFRQLGRRRKPGIRQGCPAGGGPHEQASCVEAYAGTGGAQTPASRVLLQPRGEADRAVGSALPQSQPPVPVIPPLLSWKPAPVGDSAETAPQGIQGPIPAGQPPPQVTLPAGLSLRLPPAPTAPALGPEPALGKNPCEPGWLQKPGEPGLDRLVRVQLSSRSLTPSAQRQGTQPRHGGEGRPVGHGQSPPVQREHPRPARCPPCSGGHAPAPSGRQAVCKHSDPLTSGPGMFSSRF